MNTKKLYITNLDAATRAEDLESFFSIYGDVEKIRINRKKGIGFVEMTSAPEAKRVKENLDGTTLWGRSLKIISMNQTLRHRFLYTFAKFFR